MLKRSDARNNAFILLFESAFHTDPDRSEILALAEESHEIELDDYVLSVFNGVLDNVTSIDETLSKYCRKRSVDRLSKMLLTALRIAVYEMEYTDTSAAVVINEAVNLIKTYDSPEAASYGNGVLASYVREK
jgi:N utilization substance protein B